MSALSLKNKLKALNYPTVFSDDSRELIERLLNDLIRCSEAYQQLKRDASKPSPAKLEDRSLEHHIKLLQKENNELHSKLISAEEKNLEAEMNIKKLLQEKKELSGLVKFMENGGKTLDDKNGGEQTVTISKRLTQDQENLKPENRAKIDQLEVMNEHLKKEINRLRNLYEGQIKPEVIEAQSLHLAKEEQRAREEANTSQMNYLIKRNEELEQVVKAFQNSKVPALIKEVDTLKDQLRQQTEKSIELQTLIDKSEDKILDLMDHIKEQAKQSSQLQSPSYLNKMLEDLQKKLIEKSEEVTAKEKELIGLRKVLSDSEVNLVVITKEADNSKAAFQVQRKQIEELEKKLQELTISILEKEGDAQSFAHQIKFFESRITDLNKDLKEQEALVNEFRSSEGKLRNDNQSIALELRKAQFDLEQAKTILTQKQELEQRLKNRILALETDINRKDLEVSSTSQERIVTQGLQRRVEQLEQSLAVKEEEIRKMNDSISRKDIDSIDREQLIQNLGQKIRDLEIQLKLSESEQKKVQNAAEQMKEELREKGIIEKELELTKQKLQHYSSLGAKKEEAEESLLSLKIELEVASEKLKQLRQSHDESLQQKAQLEDQLEKSEHEIRTRINENCTLQVKIKSLEEELNLVRHRLNLSEQAIERLQQKGQLVNSEVQTTAFSLTETRKLLLEKEALVSMLSEEVKKKSLLIESSNQNIDDLTSKLKSTNDELQTAGSSLQKTQKQLDFSSEKQQFLSESIKQLEQKLAANGMLNSELRDENERLVKLLNAVSSHKDELLKLETVNQRKLPIDVESQLEEARRESLKLREQIKAFTEIENDLRTKLLRLDQNKDDIQEQLDLKTEQLEEIHARFEKVSSEIMILTEEKANLKQIISQLTYQIETLSNENEKATSDLQHFSEEIKSLKTKNSRLEREKVDLASDLQILASDNRSVTNDFMICSKRVETYEKKLEAKNEEMKAKDRDLGALNLENTHLKTNCKLFEQENYTLKQNIIKLQSNYDTLQKSYRQLEQQLESLKFELITIERQKEALLREISALQNKCNQLTVELQSKDITKIDMDNEGRLLSQKAENLEAANIRMQKELHEKTRLYSNLVSEYNEMKQNFMHIKSKNDEVIAKMAAEMKKSSDLEGSLAEERSRHASILGSIYKNKALTSEVENKIESVEKLIKFK